MTTLQKGAGAAWLVAGVLVGVLTTGAAGFFLADLVRGDAPALALGPPVFVEETATAGVDQVYDGEFEFFVGGGVAAFDCDADLMPDLYVAGGTNQAGLYRNLSAVGGRLGFERVPAESTDLTGVVGGYPLDFDSDGVTDLAVLRHGENVVLRGLGDCKFERANETWGIEGGDQWTAAFSAMWEPGQTWPTLAFGNYLELDAEGHQTGSCADHWVFRPVGDGYQDPTPVGPGWCTLSVLFSDWDRSGRRDLRMTNDRHYYQDGEEQLWRMEAGKPPLAYGAEDGWVQLKIWGMGIASQDLTGDGRPEVVLTSQGDNKLQSLAGGSEGPSYEDIALARGTNAHRPFQGDQTRPSTAWHAEFDDVNNDGFVDLFIAKGNVEAQPEFADEDPNNLLLGQADGTFTEAAAQAGIIDTSRSRGAALVDLNLDGLLDLVVVDRRESVKIWRNQSNAAGNWLALLVSQDGPNRDAVGSWVEARIGNHRVEKEVTVGGGHAGGQMGWIHFGLGEAEEASIRVTWPDGETGSWHRVEGGQFVVLERGSDPAPWVPLQD